MKRKTRRNFKKQSKGYVCEKGKSLEECELEILRSAVDRAEMKQGKKKIRTPEIQEIVGIVEKFLKVKQLICYGGTAINNILPVSDQFYNKEIELPDYDFYSMNALEDAKKLADIYYKAGFDEVQASAGQHYGTYKVYVNFIPIADITQLSGEIYKNIRKEAIRVAGIYYAPPNFLRMAMYLELSRPSGDTSRWEKVLKRLVLLNKYYPLKTQTNCGNVDFQRKMESSKNESEKLYFMVRDSLIDQDVVFFGGYAAKLYSRYMKRDDKEQIEKIPDFDVLSEEPELCATVLKEQLQTSGYKGIKIVRREPIGEIIPLRIELLINNETLAFIYKPIACHNYNTINVDGKEVNIATIDTMMSFYLAFYYSNEPYHYKERILCMSKYLFDVEQKNRLSQKGLLKRFSLKCKGKQPTMETILSEKTKKFAELKDKKNTREYNMWFLRYNPDTMNMSDETSTKSKTKTKRKKNTTTRKRVRKSSGFLF